MAHGAILDDRGRAVETITATEAKNAFGPPGHGSLGVTIAGAVAHDARNLMRDVTSLARRACATASGATRSSLRRRITLIGRNFV